MRCWSKNYLLLKTLTCVYRLLKWKEHCKWKLKSLKRISAQKKYQQKTVFWRDALWCTINNWGCEVCRTLKALLCRYGHFTPILINFIVNVFSEITQLFSLILIEVLCMRTEREREKSSPWSCYFSFRLVGSIMICVYILPCVCLFV